MIAIGIGCRKGADADDIVALVRDALGRLEQLDGRRISTRISLMVRAPEARLEPRGGPSIEPPGILMVRDAGFAGPHHEVIEAADSGNGGRALTSDAEPVGLYTAAEKRGEAGLAEAASALGMPLTFLERGALQHVASRVQSRSRRVEDMFGLPSIAETAALAGAGDGAVLLVPRLSSATVSCAIAGLPT